MTAAAPLQHGCRAPSRFATAIAASAASSTVGDVQGAGPADGRWRRPVHSWPTFGQLARSTPDARRPAPAGAAQHQRGLKIGSDGIRDGLQRFRYVTLHSLRSTALDAPSTTLSARDSVIGASWSASALESGTSKADAFDDRPSGTCELTAAAVRLKIDNRSELSYQRRIAEQ